MMTSYFSKYRGRHGICIARYSPSGWRGRVYSALAPSQSLLRWYKFSWLGKKEREAEYKERYREETLNSLDPKVVYDRLSENSVLLCYEKSGDFCHRRLVAEWFEKHLGVKVPEYVREPSKFEQIKMFR